VVKPQTSPPAVLGGPKEVPRKCCGCGRGQHGPGNRDRQQVCFAWNLHCNKCQTRGHIETACKGLVKPEDGQQKAFTNLVEVTEAEMQEISEGSFFHMTPVENNRRYIGKRTQTRDSRKGSSESKCTQKLKARKNRRRKTPEMIERDRIEIAACQERMLSMMEEEDRQEEQWRRRPRSLSPVRNYKTGLLEGPHWGSDASMTETEMRNLLEPHYEERRLEIAQLQHDDSDREDEERRLETAQLQQDDSDTPTPRPGTIAKMRTWLRLGPKAPRLRDADSRSEPGTPGALGGGPVQPPGGPGGTRDRGYQYVFEDPEGDQLQRRH
jgi:hypothetical protein